MEEYYYLGTHVDGCDVDGPTVVYHYISKTLLKNRDIKSVDIWEYDLEIWPGDKLYHYAITNNIISINDNTYDEYDNFEYSQ
jgi:hypothetical protein